MEVKLKAVINKEDNGWYLKLRAESPDSIKALRQMMEDHCNCRIYSHNLILWQECSVYQGNKKVEIKFSISEGPNVSGNKEVKQLLKSINEEQVQFLLC